MSEETADTAYLSCLKELELIYGFLQREEEALIQGDMSELQTVFEERLQYLSQLDVLSQRYEQIRTNHHSVEQGSTVSAVMEDIRQVLAAIAYQNQVNQHILQLRQDHVRKRLNIMRSAVIGFYDATGYYAATSPYHRVSILR